MKTEYRTKDELLLHVKDMEIRLDEAEQILRAIRKGEVDALVVSGPDGDSIYTLKGASQPYRVFVESMSEGALTLTEDGTIFYSNTSFSEITRTPLEKIIGSSIYDFIVQEDQEKLRTILAQGSEKGSKGEIGLRGADGKPAPGFFSVSPLRIDEEIVVCATVMDLTEQKKHERILAEEKLSRAILDQASEAVVVCDSEGRVIRASRTACELCNENPLNKLFEEVFRVQPCFNARDFIVSGPVHAESVRGLEVVFNRNGRVLHLLLNAGPLLSEDQGIIGCVVTMTDISEQKQTEDALQEARDELEIRVRERTAELELRNEELQEFAFIAAHDLQEPLRKVRTFGDMLIAKWEHSLDENSKDYVRRMQTAATRMQNLLNSLLAYSRVTTKPDPMRKTDLKKSVEAALSNLELMVRDRNARVEVRALPAVEADRIQVIQLFQNLIGNALKFNREGEPSRVRIYAQNVADENMSCEICVEDNGIGFDEKYLDKIFMPFQRLHGRKEYEGVGMGLAICKKIVERHGGKITARSELGKGSTFIVTFPAKQKKKQPRKPVISKNQ